MEDRHLPPPEGWSDELRLGLERLRDGEFGCAVRHFERAHDRAPDQPEVCFALGRERLRQDDPVAAEALLRTAWLGDPSLLSAAAALARCLAIHLGELDEADSVLSRAREQHGSLPLFDVVRAEILLDRGDIEQAKHAAEAALAAAGDESSTTARAARAALARVHNHDGIDDAEDGRLDAALFAFKRAAHNDPTWSSPLVNMGAVFVQLGKPARARSAFTAALDVEPDNPTAHLDLGLLARDAGDRETARSHLERAVELDPDSGAAAGALAGLRLLAGDIDSACALLSARLERDPDDAGAWHDLGVALAAADDRGGAESCFRQAMDLDPASANVCHQLAELLAREGRYVEAALLAERARQLEPAGTP